MNNYQLNNTSVYLGGQCGWDIILTNKDSDLRVSEFQLSPLAQNIPFNKKTHSYSVNNSHSDNLKKFYQDIKENFWWTTPNINKYSKFDDTYIRGLKRLNEYSVYNKQFRFLVPLWLEDIGDKTLKFEFKFYTTESNMNRGNALDSKTIEFTPKGDEFHDKFVNYFNDWLTYLNIIPNPNRYQTESNPNEGNNRVVCLTPADRSASINGVYVSTGQVSDNVSVDYLIDNLLSIERPNVDTDYILSTLFKSHEMIVSQLFNLCFCINISDIIDPYLYRQMVGSRLNAECVVWLGDEKLENRDLFTNYEKIEKTFVEPFFMVGDIPVNGINTITGEITKDYKTYVKRAGDESDPILLDKFESDTNVLDYLKDYSDKTLKLVNKLNQHTHHWGYVGESNKTFNLYGGYNSCYVDFGKSVNTYYGEEGIGYRGDVYDIIASNGMSMTEFRNEYTPGDNSLTWLDPGKILYLSPVRTQLLRTLFNLNLNVIGLLKHDDLNKDLLFSLSRCLNVWESNSSIYNDLGDLLNTKIMIMYAEDSNGDLYGEYISNYEITNKPLMCADSGEILYHQYEDNHKYIIISSANQNEYFFILTNCMDYLVLNRLISIVNLTSITDLQKILTTAKNIITRSNEGDYFGFGSDLGIFEDDLLQQTYYKLEDQSAYVYRKTGPLTPLFTNKYKNFTYFYDDSTDTIIKGDLEDTDERTKLGITDVNYIPETNWKNGGWNLVLSPQITFTFKKNNIGKSVKEITKDMLVDYYHLEDGQSYDLVTMSDYIYKLYNINIKFEYESLTNISDEDVIYTVKLKLY